MKSTTFKSFIPFLLDAAFIEQIMVDIDNCTGEDFERDDPSGGSWRTVGLVRHSDDGGFFQDIDGVGKLAFVRFNERILPAAVRDEHLRALVNEIESKQGFKLSRKDFAQLKDEIEFDLLPKAFIKRSVVPVAIVRPNLLFVCTSSAKRAEDTIALLNGVFDTYDNHYPRVLPIEGNPSAVLTALAVEASDKFEAGDSAVLKGEQKRTIRVKDRDIGGEEVQALLQDGYDVHELALNWNPDDEPDPRMSFVLNDKLVFKRLRLDDLVMRSHLGDGDPDSDAHAFSWLVLTQYRDMLNDMIEEMGGLKPDEKTAFNSDEDDEL